MPKNTLTIATRESPLALWQANWVKERIEKTHPHVTVTLLGLTTQGDQLSIPLTEVGGKGLFVKELEEALLDGRADIAVHSMKDVPMEFPKGLILPVICEREEPRDVLVSNDFSSLNELPSGALIGTSSLRRQSQILALRPDLRTAALRGNVGTRLKKLDQGEYAAIILAAAGLYRLELEQRISEFLSVEQSLPAAGQGALGIECRADDAETQKIIAPLNHSATSLCVTAERAMCKKLNASCQVPVAAFAEMRQEKIYLRGLVADESGKKILRAEFSDKNSEKTGVFVADALLQQGAGEILNVIKQNNIF
jgi:hydroxymethylbilane synthase